MMSLVLLSKTHTALTLDQMRERLDRAFPGEFLPPTEQGSFVVEGEESGGPRLIKSLVPGAQGIFLFHHEPKPFVDAPDETDDLDDPVFLRLMRSDHSWMWIDMIRMITDETEAYRFIARALAQLAPPDSAFLMQPSVGATRFDDEIRAILAAGRSPFGDER